MARIKAKRKRRNKGLYDKLKADIGSAKSVAEGALPLEPLPYIDATRAPETTNALNNLQSLADPTFASYAGARTPEMVQYLNDLKASTAGYDSTELTALREQRRRELERGFSSGRASLARGQNRAQVGGVSRTAQLLELAKDYGAQGAAAENDLFVKGADEKQRRLETYGNALSGETQNEFDRGQSARQSYTDYLTNVQNTELDKQKANLGQSAVNNAIQTSGILGILGIGEARRNNRRTNKLLKKLNGNGYRPSSGGGGGNAAYAQALQSLADEISAGISSGGQSA